MAMFLSIHHVSITSGENVCKYIIRNHLRQCLDPSPPKPPPFHGTCRNDTMCKGKYNITVIDYFPFSMGMKMQLRGMFDHCCGHRCSKTTYADISDSTQIEYKKADSPDIIFPVLARSTVTQLHGFWYIPVFDAPVAYYIIRKESSDEVLNSTLSGLSKLWPLLCIGLVLALIAGILWLGNGHLE